MGVIIDVDDVCNIVDFKVIEIVNDRKSYLALLGYGWEFEEQYIIDLRKRQMIFEGDDQRVITPLDPIEGRRYVKPIENGELENLYNMIGYMEDYVNNTTKDMLSWHSISFGTLDFEEALEDQYQRMHKVHTSQCACIAQSVHWIDIEVCDPPKYDGIVNVDSFITTFEYRYQNNKGYQH